MKYWSKSVLSVYRYLATMTNTIDKLVLNMGKSSNSALQNNYQSTFYQASKIIELMNRKRKMINLKVAVESAISKLRTTERRIITLVFVDGVTSELISQLLGMSIRTFFRKKNQALKEFSNMLQEIGFDEEFFESEYYSEKWFMAVYDDCVSKNAEGEEILDKYLVKRVLNEVSKINMAYNNTYI